MSWFHRHIHRLLFVAVPWVASDHARGVQLMAEGKFADAVVAFRVAAETDPTNAELHYNLALALWRAGEANAAEIAAEKAATLSDGKLGALRDGILGNLKIDEANGKLGGEQPDLQAALAAAKKARDHFLHGAASGGAPAELVRNLERALKLIADIEKKIEEQKKEDDEKKEDENKDEKKDDENKDDKSEPSKDDKGKEGDKDSKDKQDKSESDKNDQQKQDQKKQGEPPPDQGENKDKPEPKPEKQDPEQEPKKDDKGQDAPQPKPGEQEQDDKPEPQPAQGEEGKGDKADDKPQAQLGQPQPGRELTPEETKRLLDKLTAILEQKAEIEKAQKAARPKVKKDW